MKKYLSPFLLLLLWAFPWTSCDIQTSDNGLLDGYWQLAEVDSLMGNQGSRDMRPTRVFWAFEHHLLQVSDQTYLRNFCLLRFSRTDNHLQVYQPYVLDREDGDKPLVEGDLPLLRYYGIQGLEEKFRIMHLDGSRMQLRSDSLVLNFVKM